MPNPQLSKAIREKNDEFYTRYEDVEKELRHYHHHLEGKIIYCNADQDWSAFIKYFQDHKETIGYKELIYTHTDFRSPENIENLKRADVVITNPPFSLFREYIALLVEHNKKFLIVGNMNAISYREIFPLIKDNKLWLGVEKFTDFAQHNEYDKRNVAGLCRWFTNLTHNCKNEDLVLTKKYNEEEYPTYTNFEAIEVSRVKNIPMDYDGVMGVPISFLPKYNPNQFEILDLNPHFFSVVSQGFPKPKQLKLEGKKDPYARILIRRKN